MLSDSIVSPTNSPISRDISLKRIAVLVGWSRQLTIQFTVLLVGLFYTCAVLEVDLGETGDSFGDVYDTYVSCAPVQSPKPIANVYRKILPAQAIITPIKRPLALSIDWSFVVTLAPLALYVYSTLKRRRLQVLHAIWRL